MIAVDASTIRLYILGTADLLKDYSDARTGPTCTLRNRRPSVPSDRRDWTVEKHRDSVTLHAAAVERTPDNYPVFPAKGRDRNSLLKGLSGEVHQWISSQCGIAISLDDVNEVSFSLHRAASSDLQLETIDGNFSHLTAREYTEPGKSSYIERIMWGWKAVGSQVQLYVHGRTACQR